jgi:hypothetical protein
MIVAVFLCTCKMWICFPAWQPRLAYKPANDVQHIAQCRTLVSKLRVGIEVMVHEQEQGKVNRSLGWIASLRSTVW